MWMLYWVMICCGNFPPIQLSLTTFTLNIYLNSFVIRVWKNSMLKTPCWPLKVSNSKVLQEFLGNMQALDKSDMPLRVSMPNPLWTMVLCASSQVTCSLTMERTPSSLLKYLFLCLGDQLDTTASIICSDLTMVDC